MTSVLYVNFPKIYYTDDSACGLQHAYKKILRFKQ